MNFLVWTAALFAIHQVRIDHGHVLSTVGPQLFRSISSIQGHAHHFLQSSAGHIHRAHLIVIIRNGDLLLDSSIGTELVQGFTIRVIK